jgi:hypothetical protein
MLAAPQEVAEHRRSRPNSSSYFFSCQQDFAQTICGPSESQRENITLFLLCFLPEHARLLKSFAISGHDERPRNVPGQGWRCCRRWWVSKSSFVFSFIAPRSERPCAFFRSEYHSRKESDIYCKSPHMIIKFATECGHQPAWSSRVA